MKAGGQVVNLRPIVNRPHGALASSQEEGRLTIGRRMPSCPTTQHGRNQSAA
jgi:hypothetical protein